MMDSVGRGDLKIHILINVPEKLSEEERKLYEQLRQLKKEQKQHWWKGLLCAKL
ncbi:MAG: hypothetical protein KAS57_04170 [Gammaproteobacteria bacterium]|nr:hypothetical protein [Gammaproteobacteria bacterium]